MATLERDVYTPVGFSFDILHVVDTDCSTDKDACDLWHRCEATRGTCTGGTAGVYCDARILRHIFAALADSLALSALSSADSAEWLKDGAQRALSLLRLHMRTDPVVQGVEGKYPSPEVAESAAMLSTAIQQGKNWTPVHGVSHHTYTKALEIYSTGAEYVLAFVLGHELAHVIGSCVVQRPLGEFDAALDAAANAQASGFGVCPLSVTYDEIEADRCGFGTVNVLDRTLMRIGDREDILPMSRVVASETVTVLIMALLTSGPIAEELAGAESHSGDPDYVNFSYLPPTYGHLYPWLRALLFRRLIARDALQAYLLSGVIGGGLALSACGCKASTARDTIAAFGGIMDEDVRSLVVEDLEHQSACKAHKYRVLVPCTNTSNLDKPCKGG